MCHKFYLDDDVSRTITAPPSGGNPVYNFCRQVTVDPMDATYVQYIQAASMTFEVWSQPLDEQQNTPLVSTPELSASGTDVVVEPESECRPEPEPERESAPVSDPRDAGADELSFPAIELAATKIQPDLESLRTGLQLLKLSELKKRAADAGISAEQIEEVDDDDDPKAAIIDLLASALAVEETPREIRLERRVTQAEAEAAEAIAKVADLEKALAREREKAAAARKALADAETKLTEQTSSSTCAVS